MLPFVALPEALPLGFGLRRSSKDGLLDGFDGELVRVVDLGEDRLQVGNGEVGDEPLGRRAHDLRWCGAVGALFGGFGVCASLADFAVQDRSLRGCVG